MSGLASRIEKATTDAPASFLLSCAQPHSHYGGACGGGEIRAGSFSRLRQPCTSHHLSDWRQWW
nr:MAG TPA_asm: hypothetical protein [Caudoviricetes sp.]